MDKMEEKELKEYILSKGFGGEIKSIKANVSYSVQIDWFNKKVRDKNMLISVYEDKLILRNRIDSMKFIGVSQVNNFKINKINI